MLYPLSYEGGLKHNTIKRASWCAKVANERVYRPRGAATRDDPNDDPYPWRAARPHPPESRPPGA